MFDFNFDDIEALLGHVATWVRIGVAVLDVQSRVKKWRKEKKEEEGENDDSP